MTLLSILRVILFYLLAVVVASVLGTLVQTQFNLAALRLIGTDIPVGVWLSTTLADLRGFAPIFALMVAVTLLLALPVAAGLGRIFKPWRGVLFFLAGAVGIKVAFDIADHLLPMPTFIAATRGLAGLLAMMLAVGIGSALFGRLTRPVNKRGLRVLG
ncbi:hypothetical protein CK507_06860 [Pseudomonas sp. WN033]|nr:hypothetical protein CK507_06860 [Pseudomonas sp. WN033]